MFVMQGKSQAYYAGLTCRNCLPGLMSTNCTSFCIDVLFAFDFYAYILGSKGEIIVYINGKTKLILLQFIMYT